MYEELIEKLKDLASTIRRVNGKYKLVILLEKAKEEYDKNNYSECRDACEKILETNPNNSVALRGLGCVEQTLGNFNKAIEYYTQALTKSEKKEIEYTLIGTVYYLQDKFDEAIKYYNLAIDENDDYDMAYDGKNQSMLERHLKIADLQDSLIKRKMF